MNKLDEVTKFAIITEIKQTPETFAQMTAPEICDWLKEQHKVNVKVTTIYRWSKLYDFKYKTRRKQVSSSQSNDIKRTNQRIRTLGIVIRNLCKELDIKHPTLLDNLLDGIVEEYGINNNCDIEVKELETRVHEAI